MNILLWMLLWLNFAILGLLFMIFLKKNETRAGEIFEAEQAAGNAPEVDRGVPPCSRERRSAY